METAATASSTLRRPGLWLPAIEQLELGDVFEEVLPHEPRRNGVAAGKCLISLWLGPAGVAFFGRRA